MIVDRGRMFKVPGMVVAGWSRDGPDGQRFVMVEILKEPRNVIQVVLNWFAEFRDRKQ
ncbi:MAG: hypothetical protein JJE04_21070 [Acidobacteriia bacterium]|nr:hypothetical protein [Terriglobia bacterium]